MPEYYKVFVGHTMVLPRTWLMGTGVARHVQQGDLLACAGSKADLAMLLNGAVSNHQAMTLARDMRLMRGTGGNLWEMALEQGIVDATQRSIYVSGGYIVGHKIVKVTPIGDGATFLPVGILDFQDPRGIGRLVLRDLRAEYEGEE